MYIATLIGQESFPGADPVEAHISRRMHHPDSHTEHCSLRKFRHNVLFLMLCRVGISIP